MPVAGMASVVGGGCVGIAGCLIALQAASNNKIMQAFMIKMFFIFMAISFSSF
jgi:branched-subunit amino acid ABC-type transport system permease component